MAVIIVLVGIAVPAFENISKGAQFNQINAHLTTLFTNAFARSYTERTGILFLRARPAEYPDPVQPAAQQAARRFQRAIPVVFSPYQVRDASGNPQIDPSSGALNMTYDVYYGVQPYARPAEELAPVDLPPEVWVAPDFFAEPTGRVVNGVTVRIPDADYDDALLRNRLTLNDSRLDRFMIVFEKGGENVEIQTDVSQAELNTLVLRPNLGARFDQNEWILTGNPVSARGVIVYDREAMLARTSQTARRDYLMEQGRPIYLSRFGGTTILGETE